MPTPSTTTPPAPCPYCGANAEGYPLSQLEKMAKCSNCLIDLSHGGWWTAMSYPLIEAMVAKHGRQTILLMAKQAGLI